MGKWGTDGLTRPNWSDSSGKIEQPKETFDLPPGWSWDGEWFPQPELRYSPTVLVGLNKRAEELVVFFPLSLQHHI